MRFAPIVFCLALLASSARGEDVFLSLTRTSRPRSEMPTSASTIGRKDFERTAARSVAEAVEGVPGLDVRRSGTMGSSQLASLRGFSSKQVLVLVDDMPVCAIKIGMVGSAAIAREP